jgi:hypothetical protein
VERQKIWDSAPALRGLFKAAAETSASDYRLSRPVEKEASITDAAWKLQRLIQLFTLDEYLHTHSATVSCGTLFFDLLFILSQ